jgi:uncharacterized Zn-binding protein involved in type VI secretion
MTDLIRRGDTTDHGGEVITVFESMRYQGVCSPRSAAEPDPPG